MSESNSRPQAIPVVDEPASAPASQFAHEMVPLASLEASRLDLERLRLVLGGLLKPPPRVTVKGIVRDHLPAISAARRRGWSIAQIAVALADGGVAINEATLRKYLPQLDVPKAVSRKPKAQRQRPAVAVLPPFETPAVATAPRRSLLRSTYLNTHTKPHEE